MPDLWDPNPDVSAADEQPDPAPDGDDHDRTREVLLKDRDGRLRLPAYVLIALAVVLATVLLLLGVSLLTSG
jgi:hypothetical protein